MKELSWGRCTLFAQKNSDTTNPVIKFPTACDGTTNLTPSKGEKKEAKIEGGGIEAVKYGANTYSGETQIRNGIDETGAHTVKPIQDNDGVIEGTYKLWLQPENPEAPGFFIANAVLGCEDAFTGADGATWKYTFDALKPSDGSNTVKWGKVSFKDNAVTFTETKAGNAA